MTRRGWLLFAALSVLWGVPYLFTKVAVGELSPAVLAWARVAVGAAVLLPIAWRHGSLRGMRGRFGLLAGYAALELVIPFPLIAWGEQAVSSSLAAIIVSSMPLVVAALAWRVDRGERLGRARLVGLAVGLSGVVLLVGIDVGGRSSVLAGALSILAATVAYALAALLVRVKLSDIDPLGAVAVSLGMGAILLAPPALATLPAQPPSPGALLAIVALGLGCTALALVLDIGLIVEVGPGRAAVITYVNPVVALLFGVGLLHESLTTAAIAGIALVLAGSWLSTKGGVAGPPAPAGRASHPARPWAILRPCIRTLWSPTESWRASLRSGTSFVLGISSMLATRSRSTWTTWRARPGFPAPISVPSSGEPSANRRTSTC